MDNAYPNAPIYHDIPLWGLWATDSACLIRHGSPLPSGLWHVFDGFDDAGEKVYVPRPWRSEIDVPAHRLMLETAYFFAASVTRDWRFAARFAPVLRDATRTATASASLGAVAVWRGDELVAVVMPLGYVEPGTAVVDVDGAAVAS